MRSWFATSRPIQRPLWCGSAIIWTLCPTERGFNSRVKGTTNEICWLLKVSFVSSRLDYVLVINNTTGVSEKDFGAYKCVASNSLGTQTKQLKLVKTPALRQLEAKHHQDEPNGKVLQWRVESKQPISKHELQYRRKGVSQLSWKGVQLNRRFARTPIGRPLIRRWSRVIATSTWLNTPSKTWNLVCTRRGRGRETPTDGRIIPI